MAENNRPSVEEDAADATKGRLKSKGFIVLIVVALFLGLILGKVMAGNGSTASAPDSGVEPAGRTITSVHNDAVADYDAALKTGRPIYVLFHSLSWQSCIEISAVVDTVIPSYEGKVEFVNAITADPSGQQLAAQFSFQYIPTSFFLKADGAVVDSFTGPMDEAEMRRRLDALVGQWT